MVLARKLVVIASKTRSRCLAVILLAAFGLMFEPDRNDTLVNLTWVVAVAIWLWSELRASPRLRVPLDAKEAWLAVALLGVFCVAWLPFYRDWRWVASGDSPPWFQMPLEAAENRLCHSVLSVRGIWDQFTYTQVIVDNVLMFVFKPTFFWHRASKLLCSVLSLAAIFVYFSLVLRSPWALAVMLATATNFIWLLFSYISYNHIDSFFWAYSVLTAFALVVRNPEQSGWWVILGTLAAWSLFFTQTAWAEVSACGIALGAWGVATRRWGGLARCGISFAVAGFPVLLQLPTLVRLSFTTHSQPLGDWAYVYRMFRTIFLLPLGSEPASVGLYGNFFFWPCGPLYLGGLVIGASAFVAPVRRKLHLPFAVAGLFALYFWEVGLLAVVNNGYPMPSPKRTYHLVAIQAFFCLLPLYVAAVVARRRPLLSHGITAATFVGIAAYAAVNLSMVVVPSRFGGTIKDGMVELRQRFADHKVVILDKRPTIKEVAESRGSIFNRAYDLADTISVVAELDTAEVDRACRVHTILCHYNKPREGTTEEFRSATAAVRDRLRKINLYDVPELDCFDCEAQ